MASKSDTSLHNLMSCFQSKIDIVKDIILLRNAEDDQGCLAMISHVDRLFVQLQITLSQLQSEVSKQKQSLNTLEGMKSELDEFMERISYVNEHIPEHIPRLTHSVSKVPDDEVFQLPLSDVTNKQAQALQASVHSVKKALSKPKKSSPELEFLTVNEFEGVPKYMKGRVTYEMMNAALGEFNKALAHKHSILTTPRNKQSVQMKNQIVAYKEQETPASDGFFFIVDADIIAKTRLKLDSAGRSCLTILRHCGRIKEVRGNQITRYCVLPTNTF